MWRKAEEIKIGEVSLEEMLIEHAKWIESDSREGRRADLKKSWLSFANLRNVILYGANLSGANLWKADLSGADLQEANLNSANANGAIFKSANLQRAQLSRAYLIEADLQGASLDGVNLEMATLQKADLRGAINLLKAVGLASADFTNAKLDEGVRQFLLTINKTAI